MASATRFVLGAFFLLSLYSCAAKRADLQLEPEPRAISRPLNIPAARHPRLALDPAGDTLYLLDEGATFSKNVKVADGVCPCCRPSIIYGPTRSNHGVLAARVPGQYPRYGGLSIH